MLPPHGDSVTDQELDRTCLQRLRAGDSAALEELVDRHSDLMFSLASRIVGNTTEAEEVLQETWLQAWRRAAQYDAARGSVGAWLVTITRSRALDRLRSARSRSRAEEAAGGEAVRAAAAPATPDATAHAEQRELSARVNRALTSLDARHREVMLLAYFQGLSQSEIAARLAAPLGTVKSWMRQALARLRELVPEEECS